ncbi:DUF3108 domain-containing protein [Falsiroseomonas tokyonensis]|uniref:DUF3108 domain-containing protein n=1 Tax=Falsiroseomonas tokyonensis TaxID=430521 RepID=A0ABV7BRV0_9PROT|nr:DUF3108 domain-containing protein [Falsiroseomonas tokyonensis]MBU8538358.1 DUF3108 domain-containing protein [Falsiroseomonas tokyonensis]
MKISAPAVLSFLGALLAVESARAQPIRAVYDVYAAGMTVLQLEAVFDLSATGYRVETQLRTRGIASTIVPGQQVAQVVGAWQAGQARPSSYRSHGTWRGRERVVVLAWEAGNPVVQALVPPDEEEREVVPADARRGTIDALSALALLSRTVAGSGGCQGQAPVFDGRRRSDFASQGGALEIIRPWGEAWHGQALRCSFIGRQVAGFLRDQPRGEAARPQQGTAWMAAPFPGAPPIPVRIEMPSRWFGTATAVLLRAESSAVAQRR